MQQQHLDQRPGALGVAERVAGGGPERVVRRGEHPGRAGLGQGGRTGQRTGFALQDLEVVVQVQRLLAANSDPLVPRDLAPASNTVTVHAPSRTRTRRPISLAGTEY